MKTQEQKAKAAAAMARWRAKNIEKARATVRAWAQRHPGRKRAWRAAEKCRAKRFAPWADKQLMADIYEYALIMRNCGIDCHVDHIIPLKASDVSGLHVESNLTVMLAMDNILKGTKWASSTHF